MATHMTVAPPGSAFDPSALYAALPNAGVPHNPPASLIHSARTTCVFCRAPSTASDKHHGRGSSVSLVM